MIVYMLRCNPSTSVSSFSLSEKNFIHYIAFFTAALCQLYGSPIYYSSRCVQQSSRCILSLSVLMTQAFLCDLLNNAFFTMLNNIATRNRFQTRVIRGQTQNRMAIFLHYTNSECTSILVCVFSLNYTFNMLSSDLILFCSHYFF